MNTEHANHAAMIPVASLRVPESYDSKPKKVDDDILRNSVKLTGVQQPLIVTRLSDKEYIIIDGVRRHRIAQSLGLQEVPCVIDQVPDDVDRTEYGNRIRFILDEHRQDLLPTQRATLIKRLQEMFTMNGKEVATFLGVTPGTITNWTLIEKLIPEVQQAIDSDRITIHAGRAFAGLTELGQRTIWEKHKKEIENTSGGRLHRFLRKTYAPSRHPEMYKSPEVADKQLKRGKQERKGHRRAKVSESKKTKLLSDVDAKRIELEDKTARIAQWQNDIDAATPVIAAMRDSPSVWECLPKSARDDFEEFAKRFVAS